VRNIMRKVEIVKNVFQRIQNGKFPRFIAGSGLSALLPPTIRAFVVPRH
jgi:hypothetical protein